MKWRIILLMAVFFAGSYVRVLTDNVRSVQSLESLVRLFCDGSIAVLGITSLWKARLWLKIAFGLLLLFSTITFFSSTEHQIIQHVNGLREIASLFFLFLFFDELFRSQWFRYFNDNFKRYAFIFLCLQLPISFYQFARADFKAGDAVGGSLGVGNSGVMTFLIFMLVLYLIENRQELRHFSAKLKYLLSLSLLFIPIILNETKISFILIPLLILVLVNIKDIKSTGIAMCALPLVFVIFSNLYSNKGQSYENPVAQIFSSDYLQRYLAGEAEKFEDVPRFTKLVLIPKVLQLQDNGLLVGQEYGVFKGGTNIQRSAFYQQYVWLLRGSVPYLFYLLVTGGLLLVGLVILLIFRQIYHKPHPLFKNYSSRFLFFLSAIFLIMLFYNNAFCEPVFLIIFSYLLFYAKYYWYTPT